MSVKRNKRVVINRNRVVKILKHKIAGCFVDNDLFFVRPALDWQPTSINLANTQEYKLDKVGAVITIHNPRFDCTGKEYFSPRFEEIEPKIETLTVQDAIYVTTTQFAHRASDGKHVALTTVYKKGEEIPYSEIPEDDRINNL